MIFFYLELLQLSRLKLYKNVWLYVYVVVAVKLTYLLDSSRETRSESCIISRFNEQELKFAREFEYSCVSRKIDNTFQGTRILVESAKITEEDNLYFRCRI